MYALSSIEQRLLIFCNNVCRIFAVDRFLFDVIYTTMYMYIHTHTDLYVYTYIYVVETIF